MDKGSVVCVVLINGLLLSHKKEWNNALAKTWIDLDIILSEISQAEKEKYHMISLNVWNLKKNDPDEHIY